MGTHFFKAGDDFSYSDYQEGQQIKLWDEKRNIA